MSGKPPLVWGPLVWQWLHSVAARWDAGGAVDDNAAVRFFAELRAVLPCKYCRDSYTEFFKHMKPALRLQASHGQLQQWTYAVHHYVNLKLNKISPSFEAVQALHATPQTGVDDPMWPALFAIALNYDDSGVADRCLHHRRFLLAAADVYGAFGAVRTSRALQRAGDGCRGHGICKTSLVTLIQRAFLEQ